MSVVLALNLTFTYFHQSLRNTACAGYSSRRWVGMFYTHSDKPRILAAPLNCLWDIIHVWAVSIRHWGSIALNAKYIRIIHLSFIQPKKILFTRLVMADSATPWTAARQASQSFTTSRSLLKLRSTESVMPSNHLILCCPLLLLSSIFPSIKVFSNESVLHISWPKYWSFSFNISPSNEHPGLISFRMDWLDLLAVHGTLKSSPTPQFKSIYSWVLSFLYCPTLTSIHDHWKNHSLD